ncbi:MAG TPA: PaaI family thioesterase [Propionibacteriaceae bacterium]
MNLDSRQRTYAWKDPTATLAAGATQDGLTLLRAISAGTLPVPPIMNTLAIEPVKAEDGKVSFTLDPKEFHLNPFGMVHGGVLATMLDTAVGCAVHHDRLGPRGGRRPSGHCHRRLHLQSAEAMMPGSSALQVPVSPKTTGRILGALVLYAFFLYGGGSFLAFRSTGSDMAVPENAAATSIPPSGAR